MRNFHLRLIVALVAGITLISLASTYFEVLAHKHVLHGELERRTGWLGTGIQPYIEQSLATGQLPQITALASELRSHEEALGLAIYDSEARLVSADGPSDIIRSLSITPVKAAIKHGANSGVFGRTARLEWLEEAVPLHVNGRPAGALVVIEDATYIHAESATVWRQSFWRIAASVVLIVGVTFLMVRWFLLQPVTRLAERLRLVRTGQPFGPEPRGQELSLFGPLARELESITRSLREARAAAAAEAHLRELRDDLWTAERLTVHVRQRTGSSRMFVVSNREPYMHVKQGKDTVCVVPPSGLVTAIEPILRACDGVWVAHGAGSEDRYTVDERDRLRVPPDDPRYTLRRVWLSAEEEAGYYDGFANEGLWPLCHIAHTRPIFRASDWESYQRVNQKFAHVLLEEMEDSESPIVFVQDYHFALLPRMIKAARPDARVAIFWHIPWPNSEAFGICPWQAELIEGLLGADLIGFHIPLHCNNFLDTVDRALESRTDREHMTVRRHGHSTMIRPYPISVSINPVAIRRTVALETRKELLHPFGVRAESIIVGVDRLDYTKGIVERLMAFERLLEEHPWHRERATLVQIAAPSRTRIPSYVELRHHVEAMVDQINRRFETPGWKPVILIERQCTHEEVARWYRVADVCLVTSLHDGMNLVAKEYLSARDDEDGVLVLSKFTGAAVELRDALIVNPYDIDGVAEAVHLGLEMRPQERRLRMQRMRRQIMEHNVYKWAASILGDLRELRIEPIEITNAGRVEPALQGKIGPHRRRA